MKFHVTYRCIILCGRGHSDYATRSVAHKLSSQLSVRVFVLGDYNPDGLVAMLTYKYGSRNRTYENIQMTVPDLTCIALHLHFGFGQTPFNPPLDSRPLSARDYAMLRNLIRGPMPLNTNERELVYRMGWFGFKMDLENMFRDGRQLENFLRPQIVEMSQYYDGKFFFSDILC